MDRGVAAADAIADDYCGPALAALGRAYLRDNIEYTLDTAAEQGLRRYYALAARHGVVSEAGEPVFY